MNFLSGIMDLSYGCLVYILGKIDSKTYNDWILSISKQAINMKKVFARVTIKVCSSEMGLVEELSYEITFMPPKV